MQMRFTFSISTSERTFVRNVLKRISLFSKNEKLIISYFATKSLDRKFNKFLEIESSITTGSTKNDRGSTIIYGFVIFSPLHDSF